MTAKNVEDMLKEQFKDASTITKNAGINKPFGILVSKNDIQKHIKET